MIKLNENQYPVFCPNFRLKDSFQETHSPETINPVQNAVRLSNISAHNYIPLFFLQTHYR